MLLDLYLEKWNEEIWNEMIQAEYRFKDLQTQKILFCFESNRSNLKNAAWPKNQHRLNCHQYHENHCHLLQLCTNISQSGGS